MSTDAAEKIRLLLVDDHTLFRESLARLLQSEPGFEVVEHCSSGFDALRAIRSHQVDVILLDLDLGPERGIDILEELHSLPFEGKILLVTAGVNPSDVPKMIQQGIAGIFMKNSSPSLLIQGIRETMRGKVWFDQSLLQRAFETPQTPQTMDSEVQRSGLTKRERQVLSFVFQGLTNKEIASRLEISESSVKACLQHLFTKTGVRTRSQLVRVALERYRDDL